jgi:hypothetical protein
MGSSFQEMKDDMTKDELTSIKERIATAKANHKSNLERLYAAHAEDYLDDQRLRRESREEYAQAQSDGGKNKLAEWSAKRDVRVFPSPCQPFRQYQSLSQPLASTDHHYLNALLHSVTAESARYATVIHSLSLQKAEIELQAEEERRRRDAAFPLSLVDFHSKPRDIQIRVANFLSSDARKKEKMMSEFGWAYRQVDVLVKEFGSNVSFIDNKTRV